MRNAAQHHRQHGQDGKSCRRRPERRPPTSYALGGGPPRPPQQPAARAPALLLQLLVLLLSGSGYRTWSGGRPCHVLLAAAQRCCSGGVWVGTGTPMYDCSQQQVAYPVSPPPSTALRLISVMIVIAGHRTFTWVSCDNRGWCPGFSWKSAAAEPLLLAPARSPVLALLAPACLSECPSQIEACISSTSLRMADCSRRTRTRSRIRTRRPVRR